MKGDSSGAPDVDVASLEGAELLRRAELGDAGAQLKAGIMCYFGSGVPQDYAEAARWHRLAAEQGNAVGQVSVGSMYCFGTGVPEDKMEAVRWYRLAAEQGYADGQWHLGSMYELGVGVPKDQAEAVRLYRLAAEQGSAVGQAKLGSMYFFGAGVPRNYVKAYAWIDVGLASLPGEGREPHETYRTMRDELLVLMTREQVVEAHALSRDIADRIGPNDTTQLSM